MCPKH
jgi:hypothetical protein